ncbi:MAG: pilus assembly protein [Oscillospiraceae bacterium]|nr:pilus assembly protein [Oscillospiraceae bacterium]
MKKNKRKNQSGMITVETVLAFIPFIFVVFGIISFTNVFMVHNRIQHALHQTASELSSYTYLYHATGVRNADLQLNQDIDVETRPVDQAIEDVNRLLDSIDNLQSSGNRLSSSNLGNLKNNAEQFKNRAGDTYAKGQVVVETGKYFMNNPKELISGLSFLLIEKAEDAVKNFMLSAMASGLMNKYLDQTFAGGKTADAYLKNYGVVNGMAGLDFSNSQLFTDANLEQIDIHVTYQLELPFISALLDDATITMSQRVVVPAWLDGDGKTCEKG